MIDKFLSEKEIQSAINQKLKTAMERRLQAARRRSYLLLSFLLLLLCSAVVLLYFYSFDKSASETTKAFISSVLPTFMAIYGSLLGYYFGSSAKNRSLDDIYFKEEKQDLDIYRDFITTREENTALKHRLFSQRDEYEKLIAELKKQIDYLNSFRGSKN